jgi:hypothetical protein
MPTVAIVASVVLPLLAVDKTRIVARVKKTVDYWRMWALTAAIVPGPVTWMGALLYPGCGGIGDLLALLRT